MANWTRQLLTRSSFWGFETSPRGVSAVVLRSERRGALLHRLPSCCFSRLKAYRIGWFSSRVGLLDLSPEHPDTLLLRDSLAIAIAKQKRYQEAEEIYAETLVVIRRVFGPNHPTTAASIYNIACLEAVH